MRKGSKFTLTYIWQVALLILTIGSQLWALDPEKKINQYKEDKWEIADGLPTNEILSISQTPDGYLWLATKNGLIRYDGVKFTNIPFADKKKIAPIKNIIPVSLFLDRTETLWIGGEDALTSHDYRTGQFKNLTRKDGFSGEPIRRVIDDTDGNLWISFFNNYVARYSNGKFTYFNSSNGLKGKKINSMIQSRNGYLLFGSRESGIFKYQNGKFSEYMPPSPDKSQLISMCEDSEGSLWIGKTNGLYLHSPGQKPHHYTSADGLPGDYVSYIIQDSNRTLWIGTIEGLARIRKNKGTAIQIEPVLSGFKTLCLFEDKEKNIWIGTLGSGLKRLKDMKIIFVEHQNLTPRDTLTSTYQSTNGDILIGTLNGKLIRSRENKLIETVNFPELLGAVITSIAEDNTGDLWLGTIGKGVFQKKRNQNISYTIQNGLIDNTVNNLIITTPYSNQNGNNSSRDSLNDIWIETAKGVNVIRQSSATIQSFDQRNGLIGEYTYCLIEDTDHNILIGTNKGITILKNGDLKKVGYIDLKTAINCIYEDTSASHDDKHIYWISTYDSGFKRLEVPHSEMNKTHIPFKMTSFTTTEGMLTNRLFKFVEDQKGYFWLRSETGIFRLNKAELNRFVTKPIGEITCVPFGKADGMQNFEFDSGMSSNSVMKTRKGEIWFNTLKGVALVNPEKIPIDKTPPYVIVEAVFHNGRFSPLNYNSRSNSRIHIIPSKTERNRFKIYFTVATFVSPEKVKFKYQLEGYDKGWVSLPGSSERAAYYNDIEPGTYHFKVIASNADGVWNLTGDSVTLVMESTLFQTLRYKFLLPILIIAIILLLIRIHFYQHRKRMDRLEQQKREEQKRIEAAAKEVNDSSKLIQSQSTIPKEPVAITDESAKRAPINPEYAKELIKNLTYQMEINKLYRESDISLKLLADKIKTTSHILSQLLNENMKQGFADYINTYRINEAKKILEKPAESDKKISAIAGDVGFNTMAAFYNAFKKIIGKTPSEYREEFRKKEKH